MRFAWSHAKNERNIEERGIDFGDVTRVFEGPMLVARDERMDYGEVRWMGLGQLEGRLLVVVWTYRGDVCRLISARKANNREVARHEARFSPAG